MTGVTDFASHIFYELCPICRVQGVYWGWLHLLLAPLCRILWLKGREMIYPPSSPRSLLYRATDSHHSPNQALFMLPSNSHPWPPLGLQVHIQLAQHDPLRCMEPKERPAQALWSGLKATLVQIQESGLTSTKQAPLACELLALCYGLNMVYPHQNPS